MTHNFYHRNKPKVVNVVGRTVWFILTALLILPLYADLDRTLGWAVLFPLISVFTALAGITGVDHPFDMLKKYHASETQSLQHAKFADTH